MNFYPFHIGDYAAHTRNLSLLEDLAYRRLLDAYYLAEQPFNGSPTDVAREIGMRDQVDAVEYILGKFFERDGDLWRNKRADLEIAKYAEKKDKASKAGKASAERRLNAGSTDVGKVSTDVGSQVNGRSTNQEPRTKNQKNTVVSPLAPPADRGSRLDKNWALPAEWRAWCLENRPDLDPDKVAEQFRDFWVAKPGKDGRKSDWLATWRNWCRSQQKTGPNAAARPRQEVFV